MIHTLTPGLLDVDGRLIESYQRVSQATDEAKTDLGLPTDSDTIANLGVVSVEEFIILQTAGIPKSEFRSWNLSRIGQDVKIESVFIDAPNVDSFAFEVLKNNQVVFIFHLNRNKTPYDFPENPLTPDLTIRIRAKSPINLLRIVLKPVVILETLISEEEILNNQVVPER